MQSLEKALAIGGAVAVAVFSDVETVWSAGVREPAADDAAAAGVLVRAATALTRMADPQDEPADILITTTTSFHVLRGLAAADGGDLVAHLTLTRGVANLALARREFKALTDGLTAAAADPPEPAPAPSPSPAPTPLPRSRNGSATLPRRPVGRHNSPPAAADTDIVPPGWLAMVGQPYVADDAVLDRIIGSLKHL